MPPRLAPRITTLAQLQRDTPPKPGEKGYADKRSPTEEEALLIERAPDQDLWATVLATACPHGHSHAPHVSPRPSPAGEPCWTFQRDGVDAVCNARMEAAGFTTRPSAKSMSATRPKWSGKDREKAAQAGPGSTRTRRQIGPPFVHPGAASMRELERRHPNRHQPSDSGRDSAPGGAFGHQQKDER
ncbi:hypothetical protein [Demequina sp. NBRC 110051]|uniref:hypothetical protein n=1 Tax=Demequina sp. NBRC 110051 TaxID=1570340 RepID=UPI000A06FC7C|nr:hypothetical protein [Demequina sp. NBRC 110051]